MKKTSILLYFILLFFSLSAQNTFSNSGTKVGIGTTDPQALLHIHSTGNSNILLGSLGGSDYSAISLNGSITDNNNNNWNFLSATGNSDFIDHNLYINRPTNHGIYFRENNVSQMSILPGGNVGIGTESPFTQFSLGIKWRNEYPTYYSNDQSGLNYYYPGQSTAIRTLDIVSNGYNDPNICHCGGSEMRFLTNSVTSTTAQQRMKIDRDGNFIIGDAGVPANINVPVGASTGGYNFDFHTWRDIVSDQIGARIRADRINNFQNNNALVQSMDLAFYTSAGFQQSDLTERLRIKSNGNVGIGTSNPQAMLAVKGTMLALRVKVSALSNSADWPDYVFKKDYKLRSLKDLETYICKYNHLPDVPSALKVRKGGLDLGATQAVLLKKIEELTLYVIEQGKEIQELKKIVKNKR